MKALGQRVDCSDSFISHLENGRADLPNGVLLRILDEYEIGMKYFNELVRDKDKNPDNIDIIKTLVNKLSAQQASYVRSMIEEVLRGPR